MQILFGQQLKDMEGKEILNTKQEPATLRGVVVDALLAPFEDEKALSGEEKLKRWELAMKLQKSADPLEVTAEEVALMKKLIGKAYAPMIVGQTWYMLEGRSL